MTMTDSSTIPITRDQTIHHLYRLFADLLEYPTHTDLAGQAKACTDLLPTVNPEAATLVDEFRAFVEQTPSDRLEELYTSTFDLQVVCYPYVGYQLFGESYKRGAFLARLNEGYRARDFTIENELPDHLPVILRFLALGGTGEFAQTLVGEGVIPAVDKMAQTFGENGDNPYSGVIQALLLVLREEHGEVAVE
ncbi:MAG: nitrate reductase molybdenum cofactor assembly chaperone [Chloroflexi bacterium]|nr:nitrate reductase molybdenum cofactor assembly chaperone [Chloroflexota bacterium]